MHNLTSVITKLEAFVQGTNTSVPHANEIEGELADMFDGRDDCLIEDFIYDLAFYRPEGGEGLCDYKQLKPMAEAALHQLKLLHNENE